MNQEDFVQLRSLLAKLNMATSKAAVTDVTFKKYHAGSIQVLKEFPVHLRQLEQGLKTAKVLVPQH
ncbi:MAG: hypothetical protein AAF960_11580 [Bacteroidota bacterium]